MRLDSLLLLTAVAGLIGVTVVPSGGGAFAAGPNGRSPMVNYMTECQGCHLPDGVGMAGKVPRMKGNLSRFLSVEGGRQYLVQVPGSANSKLSDSDLAQLLNWMIVSIGGTDAGAFQLYTAAEVATYRAERLVDVTGRRAELVARFSSR